MDEHRLKEDFLMHYGTKEHSGRYPWGSGENPYQRLGEGSIRARKYELEQQGMSEKEIADALGMSTTVLRQRVTMERAEEDQQMYHRIHELHEKGYSNVTVGNMLGISEGKVRQWLKDDRKNKVNSLRNTADQLAAEVKKKKYLDVGEGTHLTLNCSETKLQAALSVLKDEGYTVHKLYADQLGTNHKTTYAILTKDDVTTKYLYDHMDQIHLIDESRRIDTNGDVKLGAVNPRSVDRKRIMVRYGDQGGEDRDGVIELRRGVDDISLGSANYAQVRIAVDDKYYMKGMAVYSDNMPKGVDIIYNTNKKSGAPDEKVFKAMKLDDNNPFGATIKGLYDEDKALEDRELKLTQRYYTDKDGKKQLSCINVVNEEGTWDTWSKSLSSQFLSKQPAPLAKRQLELSLKQSVSDFEDIMKITEPTVRRNMLEQFADKCDAAAVDLKASALPRQSTKVLLPVPSLKDGEVYAPTYKTGEHVALIRYPHGGTFEIPVLTVNNGQKEGKSVVGNSREAIGVNSATRAQLSGADCDGDTVIVIPVDNIKLKTSKPLKGLLEFDPKAAYPRPEGVAPMKEQTKQIEMGKISNLITDMSFQNPTDEELERAVKHSMVVIDAVKHDLDYRQSAKDNGINELKRKYRGSTTAGASTIISRASHEIDVPERRQYYKIDPKTGKRIFIETGRKYTDKNGKEIEKTSKTTLMDNTEDAFTLTSDGRGGYPIENVYAQYANSMKDLGNKARKAAIGVQDRPYLPSAAQTYADEVRSLETKLLLVQKNAPRERQAQLVANSSVKAQLAEHPEWKNDKDRLKKIKGQALSSARANCGAKSETIHFTDREWEAIQSGAIKKTKLEKIIDHADKDELRQRATPRATNTLSQAKVSLIKAYTRSGMTQEEISQILGVSTSTISKALAA